jgi:signal transduction histidine kinase
MIAIIGVTTDISQRKKMEEAQQWEAAVNASMAEISQALLTMESTEEISQLVLDHAQQLTGSTFGYVGHIDPETGHLICTTMTHEIWDVCEVEDKDIIFEEFGGLWGWVLDHREPLMTNQPSEDQRSSGTPEGHISINRFVSAPAMIGDELVGQIALANPGRPYEERDLRLTERLANVYALAVQHARTERRLEAYSEQLEEMVKERTQELREAQERLLRRKKLAMLGQLAGSVSHELRGPLGSIKNSAYFLQLALEDPAPDVQETLDILNEEIARSETIIDSMLDFARTETPNRQPVSANVLVENALNRVKVPDTIDVELNLEDTLPTVAADPKQLLGVFENITKNAVEAMPEGGKLRVKSNTVRDANEEPVQVEIAFADNGVGITEKDLERVFEPLFSTKEGGTGLGLPLAQALVEAHGGSITVKSRVGEGSTFTVLLPVERKGI